MRKLAVGILLISLILLISGCAAVLVGAGVVGGIELSTDSAKVAKDTSFESAYAATHQTLQQMGTIIQENKYSGRIEAEVRDSKIKAQISRVSRATVSIKITARKKVAFLPNPDLAQEILNNIMLKM